MRFTRVHLLTLVLSLTATTADARMLRVVSIEDAQTIVVNGMKSTRLVLAGVAITDPAGARAFLQSALRSAWITAEKRADGFLVWRSPDAMFINRELVSRGYARATSAEFAPPQHFTMTHLGNLYFIDRRHSRITSTPESGTDTASRPRERPKPQPRQARKRRAAPARSPGARSSAP